MASITQSAWPCSQICTGLISDRYAVADGENAAVAVQPRMFKNLVGKGHSEFASARQQDAVEYFQHLLETMTRAERQAKDRLAAGAHTWPRFGLT